MRIFRTNSRIWFVLEGKFRWAVFSMDLECSGLKKQSSNSWRSTQRGKLCCLFCGDWKVLPYWSFPYNITIVTVSFEGMVSLTSITHWISEWITLYVDFCELIVNPISIFILNMLNQPLKSLDYVFTKNSPKLPFLVEVPNFRKKEFEDTCDNRIL